MPITSPALTLSVTLRSGMENGVAGLRLRLLISSSGSAFSMPSTASRTTACTSEPTIIRASEAAVSLRGSQWATTLPWRMTVAASHMRFTSSRRCEM